MPQRFFDQRLKLPLLRVADALDTHGSLLKAPAALGLGRSALTRSLRELEEITGAALFERHPRGVRPLPGSEASWRGAVAPDDARTAPRALLLLQGRAAPLGPPAGQARHAGAAGARLRRRHPRAAGRQPAGVRRDRDRPGPFFARGGRRLLWHGLADQGISPRTTLAWWRALRRDQGAARVDAAARLFLVPGLAHCRSGAGDLTEFDALTPLLRWVEEGVAPDSLAGGRVAPTDDGAPEAFLDAERFGPRRQQVSGDSR